MAEPFPLSGDIDPNTFPFLLADLHRRGATGSLKVEGSAYPKALYFRGGKILFGSSHDPGDQLGAILIEQGKITQEQLDDVNGKVGPGNPLAKVLAESGYVNQRELGEAARLKVERILSDVISYTSGSFDFEDSVLPKGAVDLKLPTEKLILSAVRRLGDRAFALRHLDSLQVVLAPTAELTARMGELRAETADLPDRLDGRRTLKEAAALTHLEEFEAAKVACALVFLGLARRADQVDEVTAAPPAGEEIDLSSTVRAAVGEGGFGETMALPPPAREESEAPFFTDDSAAAATPIFPHPDDSAFKITPPTHPDAASEPEPFAPAREERPAFAAPEPEVYGLPSEPPPGTDFASPPELEPPPMPAYACEPAPTPARTPIPTRMEPPPAPAAPPPSFPSFEDTGPAPTVASRPSKEDLAALDALLNPNASRGPGQPLSPVRSERWEPQFRPTSGGRRASPRKHGGAPLLLYGLAAALVAAAGGGAWYYLNVMQAGSPRAARASTPSPPTSTSAAGAGIATVPSPVALSPPAASPSVEPTPAASPVAVASVAPTPAPSTGSSASRSPEPVTAAPGGAAPAEARSLMQKGAFPHAASAYATNLKAERGSFSVQILVACSTETIQKAVDSAPSEDLFILPVNYKGKSCYRVCWGVFESEGRATSALQSLPDYFVKGGATPKVAPLASLLP